MTTETKLTWSTIDPKSLPEGHRKAYDAYKVAYAKASEARKAFETMVNSRASLPEGKTIVFGYRFGQLSVAIGDTVRPKASKAQALGAFLDTAKPATA